MDERDRENIAGLAAIVLILAAVFFLGHLLFNHLQTERCVMEGRRDCTPLPQPGEKQPGE